MGARIVRREMWLDCYVICAIGANGYLRHVGYVGIPVFETEKSIFSINRYAVTIVIMTLLL